MRVCTFSEDIILNNEMIEAIDAVVNSLGVDPNSDVFNRLSENLKSEIRGYGTKGYWNRTYLENLMR
jgi:hypothetical protein